jgi:subtilisin family serine protease
VPRLSAAYLEARLVLSASPDVPLPLLIQVKSVPMTTLAPVASADGAALRDSGVPGVLEAAGADQALTQLAHDLAGVPGLGFVERASLLRAGLTPNDPSFKSGSMWGMNGSRGINAPGAWDVTTGSTKVVVADIDTGMDYDHPDLYLNVWINQQEIPSSRLASLTDEDHDGLITFYDLNYKAPNGTHPNEGSGKITDINGDGVIDAADILSPMVKNSSGRDTGQGGWADGDSEDGDTAHPDDLVGWNFVNNTNNPFDDNGHGTHTAGTIGAIGNNGVGVVGVNWRVQIMPLKFLDSSGNGTDADAAAALVYAANHGARVSNNSYGGGGYSQTMINALNYAAGKGDVFVAAAGNSGHNTDVQPNYPSAYPNDNILAVAAIASSGALAGFSNYGPTTVDLAAPGVGIVSTLPNGRYGSMSGTSMATPHVTGAVALVLAEHPSWSYTKIIQDILDNVTPDSSVAGKTASGGILNASAALHGGPSTSVTFVGTDTATKGSWRGAYGDGGYDVLGDQSSIPSYATLNASGQKLGVWAATTSDPRALQKASNPSSRVAAGWLSGSFTVDVNLTDGKSHNVSLYLLDWNSSDRSERIDVVDASTGLVLDTRTASSFHNGEYLTWSVSGHVLIRFTRLAGFSAALSGIFFA